MSPSDRIARVAGHIAPQGTQACTSGARIEPTSSADTSDASPSSSYTRWGPRCRRLAHKCSSTVSDGAPCLFRKACRIHGAVSRERVRWKGVQRVQGAALEEVLYHKAVGEGIAKVGSFLQHTRCPRLRHSALPRRLEAGMLARSRTSGCADNNQSTGKAECFHATHR